MKNLLYSDNQDDNFISKSSGFLKLHLFLLPIVLRFYPGIERKFCIYGMLKVYIAVSASFKEKRDIVRDIDIDDGNYNKVYLKDDPYKQYGLKWGLGCDYETNCGLIIGTQFVQGLEIMLAYNFHSCLFKK